MINETIETINSIMSTVKEVVDKDEQNLRVFFEETRRIISDTRGTGPVAESKPSATEGKVSEIGFLGSRAACLAIEDKTAAAVTAGVAVVNDADAKVSGEVVEQNTGMKA